MLSTPHENAVEQVREPFLAPCRSGGSEHSGLLRHYQDPHGLRNHLSASDQRSNHLRSGVCEADGARFHQRYHIQQAAGRRGFHGSRAAGVFRRRQGLPVCAHLAHRACWRDQVPRQYAGW